MLYSNIELYVVLEEDMIQKHTGSKNVQGTITLNKTALSDIGELYRLMPSAARIWFLLIAYADDANAIITDVSTISKMLGMDTKLVKCSLIRLVENGYITIINVRLRHENDLIGVQHDEEMYENTDGEVWKVIREKYLGTISFKELKLKIKINDNIVQCSNNQRNNILIGMDKDGKVFYDTRIRDNEIIWEF